MGDITYFLRIISYRKLHTKPPLSQKNAHKKISKNRKQDSPHVLCNANAINYYDRIRLVFFVWRFLDS